MLQPVRRSRNVPGDRPATYDDLVRVPEHLVAEIVDGVLYTSPRPASRHGRASSRLGGRLEQLQEDGDGPGGWWIVDEPELHFGSDVLVPDLAGWRVERMPEFPDVAFFTLAPDWICEVLSPSTRRLDRTKKMPVYGREGVAAAWILDPIARTLEVFMLEQQRLMPQTVHRGDERARVAPFETLELPLVYLWGKN